MRGITVLVLVGLMVVAALAALTAGAGIEKVSIGGQGIYKSSKCNRPVKPYDFAAWACTTVTVVPSRVTSGGKVTVTFSLRAKATLHYVQVCVSRMIGLETTKNCAWQHRYAGIAKGATVKHVLRLAAPTVSTSGTYGTWTYAWFYKPPKYASAGDSYWAVHAFACVVADGDASFVCPLGK